MSKISDFFWFMVLVFLAMIAGFFILTFLSGHGPSLTRNLAGKTESLAQG